MRREEKRRRERERSDWGAWRGVGVVRVVGGGGEAERRRRLGSLGGEGDARRLWEGEAAVVVVGGGAVGEAAMFGEGGAAGERGGAGVLGMVSAVSCALLPRDRRLRWGKEKTYRSVISAMVVCVVGCISKERKRWDRRSNSK